MAKLQQEYDNYLSGKSIAVKRAEKEDELWKEGEAEYKKLDAKRKAQKEAEKKVNDEKDAKSKKEVQDTAAKASNQKAAEKKAKVEIKKAEANVEAQV